MTFVEYLKGNRGKELVIGGHRGHQSDIRENTIRNFTQLLGKGIPYIEIDVQMTKDGELVLFHDCRLEASTGLPGEVRDYTLAQLREAFPIDTVADTIRWCAEENMGVAFELKFYPQFPADYRQNLVRKLCGLIDTLDFRENCFVFGKDYEILGLMRSLDPWLHLGIIGPKNPREALPLIKKLDAFLYLDYVSSFTKDLVAQLHEAGCLVDGSVVNRAEDLEQALRLGIDMVESDYPEKLIALHGAR